METDGIARGAMGLQNLDSALHRVIDFNFSVDQ